MADAKQERRPTGIRCRDAKGVRIPCGCNPDTTPPCGGGVLDYNCEQGIMPTTYKVHISEITPCDKCSGTTDGTTTKSYRISGTIDRDFYILGVTEYITSEPNGHFSAMFFCGAGSANSSLVITQYDSSDCSGTGTRVETLPIAFDLTAFDSNGNPVVGNPGEVPPYHQFIVAEITLGGILVLFATSSDIVTVPTYDPTTPPSPYVVNFCSSATSADAMSDPTLGHCDNPEIVATGGTATFTPCPPCAVACAGAACVSVTTSGSCTTWVALNDATVDVTGNYELQGMTTWVPPYIARPDLDTTDGTGIVGVWQSGPAGCFWVYQKMITIGSEWLTLRLWSDGVDFQGLLTHTGVSDTGVVTETNMAEAWASQSPGTVTCTSGELAGSLTLAGNPDGSVPQCTLTVTFGDCSDCHEATASYTDNTIIKFNGGASYDPGTYKLQYIDGAVSYGDGLGYSINLLTAGHDGIYYGPVATDPFTGDSLSTSTIVPGNSIQYTTQADCETANSGVFTTFHHDGGPIGIQMQDDPASDNTIQTSAPRFRLCLVSLDPA